MSLENYASSPGEAVHAAIAGRHVRLGKLAKKEDDRNLMMTRYLAAGPALPKPPKSIARTQEVPAWPMYDNDSLGDCTCAAVGHAVQQTTAAAGALATPPDKTVTDLYWATGSSDNGRQCLDVLNYWRSNGLDGGDRITAFAEVNPKDRDEVKRAITLFGNVYLGIQLPKSAQTQTTWEKPRSTRGDGAPGSWGGHCVPGFDYDSKYLTCVTWGQTLKMSWNFFEFYCDEAYVVMTPDWLNAVGASPADAGGFNIAQLQSDLAALKA